MDKTFIMDTPIPEIKTELNRFLEAVNLQIQRLTASGSHPLKQSVTHLFHAGGKKIRPTLVFLSAALQPLERQNLINTAASVELIHTASLIHDDIIDLATQRRGRITVNHRWDNLTAVLTGDFLFATAFNFLTASGNYPVLLLLCQSIQQMCEGEINQARQTFNLQQTEDDYFKNIFQKTASLFAVSSQAGAITAGLTQKQVMTMHRLGLYLGFAYQIMDDLLDLVGDPKELGKPTGGDLRQGILTLPVLRCLKDPHYGAQLRQVCARRKISHAEFKAIRQALLASDAVPYTLKYLNLMLNRAGATIGDLPLGPKRFQISRLIEHLLSGPIRLLKKGLTDTTDFVFPNCFAAWIHQQESVGSEQKTSPPTAVAAPYL